MKSSMAKLFVVTVLAVSFLAVPRQGSGDEWVGKAKKKPLIQIALLLDTSNSMDGLINQAKSQLWKIVNEFTLAKRGGQRPEIQVALYEYGNDGLPASEGHIRMVLPLTNDLDKVSEQLFALTTNGGSEYCGQVIQAAGNQLQWSKDSNDLKVIVIAGNEPFTQGTVDYRDACKGVIGKGVIVNTIHCGSFEEGANSGWKDGALLADGTYMNIDSDRTVVHVDAPQDAEIARLGADLNTTYIPYGAMGEEAAARQVAQDSNAASVAAGSSVNRAIFKSAAQYNNAAWDLVDAVEQGKAEVTALEEEALPEDMRKMSKDERKKYVEERSEKRKDLQEKIKKLNAQREDYVAKKLKEQSGSEADTLDSAMIKAMRKQAVERSFTFE